MYKRGVTQRSGVNLSQLAGNAPAFTGQVRPSLPQCVRKIKSQTVLYRKCPMTAETRPEANSETPAGGTPSSASRRRLFKGVAGGTGVLLSVHAKTALGTGICQSPSGRMSGNQSPRPGTGVVCTPGDHPNTCITPGTGFGHWPSTCAKPAFKSDTTNTSKGNLTFSGSKPTGYRDVHAADMSSDGLLMSSVVSGAPSIGLWRAMSTQTCLVGSNRTLLAYLCAAWINCQKYTASSGRFPISDIEVKRMAEASVNGQFYCPSSLLSCGTSAWTPVQVLSYLQLLMGSGSVNCAYVKNGTNGITV